MPVKSDFGSVVARFTETDGVSPLGKSALCAFDFSPSRVIAITHIAASVVDVSNAGFCASSRVLVVQGHVNDLGALAREALTLDIETKYGVKILHDTIGISGQWDIDLSGNPIVTELGSRLYVIHLPPYSETDGGVYIDSILTLSLLGFYPKANEQEVIYPNYKLR